MTNLIIEKVTITEFKKQYKEFLKKKLKPQIVQISQSSDFTSDTKVVQIISELKQDILTITSRGKIIGYAVKSVDVLKNKQGQRYLSVCDGALNYVSKLENQKEVDFTFKPLTIRSVGLDVYSEWEQVNSLLNDSYKTKNEVIEKVEGILGSKITKENIVEARNIFKQNKDFVELIKLKESVYREAFEGFIKNHGFNCFDYELQLEVVQ